MRPAGADNYVKWRRAIDEHLELRRLTWDEYAMFSWLCTKANARTGTLRTSWPTLAGQTGLSPAHVEVLCRGLKCKCYIWYPKHRGQRGRLVEVAIHKFPLPGDGYTDLRARFEEVRLELPLDVPSKLPLEVTPETGGNPPTSPSGRKRKRSRREETLRVRAADPDSRPEETTVAEALGQARRGERTPWRSRRRSRLRRPSDGSRRYSARPSSSTHSRPAASASTQAISPISTASAKPTRRP